MRQILVRVARLELARFWREILSLLCLPISPYPQKHYYTTTNLACQQLSGTPAQIRTERISPFERDDFTNLSTGAIWWAR